MARIVGTAGPAPRSRQPLPPKRARPGPKKPFVLQGPHDVGTTAQPPRRGHAPTVFQQPLGTKGFGGKPRQVRTPPQQIQAQQQRHTARAVARVQGHPLPARPLTQGQVNQTLGLGRYSQARVPTSLALLGQMTPQQMKRVDFNKLARVKGTTVIGPSAARAQAQRVQAGARAALPRPHRGGFSLTPAGVINEVGAELQGTGLIERGIQTVGAASAQGWQQGLAKVGLPGVGRAIGRVPQDTASVLAGTVPALYLPGKALAERHPGRAFNMFAKPIGQTFAHPVKSFEQHPVGTFLILRGAEGAASRLAGEAARTGAFGAAASALVKDDRLPLSLGGAALDTRKPSKGLLEAGVQKKLDQRAFAKRGTTVRVPVRGPAKMDEGFRGHAIWHSEHADHPVNVTGVAGKHGDTVYMKVEGSQAGVPLHELEAPSRLQYTAKVKAITPTERQRTGARITGGGKGNRRADREYNAAVQIVQNRRGLAVHPFDRSLPKRGLDAIELVNRGVLKNPKTVVRDLGDYLEQLHHARLALKDPAELAENGETIRKVEGLLADDKFVHRPEGAFKAARVFRDTHQPLEAKRELYGDLAPGQAERRTLLDFAVRELGLRHDETTGRFHSPDGKFVPNEQIRQEFTRRGGDLQNLAYVPLRRKFTGAQNFYGAPNRRPGAETQTFTGAAALSGVHETGVEVLRNQLAKAATRVARHETTTHLMNTYGLKQKGGKFFDYDSAVREGANLTQAARNRGEKNPEEYVPVVSARQSAPEGLMEEIHPATAPHTFQPAEPGDSHVVLMPKSVMDRFGDQTKVHPFAGRLTSALTRVNRFFRHTVLSTSTKWLTGDSVEAYLRMQVHELTPVQIATTIRAGVKMEKRIGKMGGEAAVERLQAAGGRGLYGSQKGLDQYDPNAKGLSKFVDEWSRAAENLSWKDPKRLGHLWASYRQAVRGFNTVVAEKSPYYYVLGKAAKNEVKEMTSLMDRALGKAGGAYEDVANGLLQSNKIDEFARELDRIRGRYSNLSPEGRWFTTVLTPFGNWWVNAAYFVGVTMPLRHPVKQGLIAAAVEGTQKQREQMQLPPWARTSVPKKNGQYIAAEHFLPYGIFQGANPDVSPVSKYGALTTMLQGLGGAGEGSILPQISGVQMAIEGKSWTGQDLPPGTSPVVAALYTTAETMVPLVGRTRQVLERGGVSKPGSTIFHPMTKPNTRRSIGRGFARTFNPFNVSGGTPGVPGGKVSSSGGGVDWSRVKIPSGGGGVDWSKVKIGP